MRLAAYQFAVCGELDHNLEIVKKTVIQAAENRVDLIVFPECALTGYPPRDIAGSDSVNVNGVSEAIQEFQRLVEQENDLKKIEWDAKRFLSKNNYLIQALPVAAGLLSIVG